MNGELLAVVGGAVAALVLVVVFVRRKPATGGGRPAGRDRQLDEHLAAGRFDAAAARASELGEHAQAVDLWIRAGKPQRAAQAAHRAGLIREAAELYERVGEGARAAALYRQLGMTNKADELSVAPAAPGTEAAATPRDRALARQQRFDGVRRRADARDPVALAELRPAAEDACEAWLEAGDVRRAADACRDGGLVDQGVNLYANLLGDPGAAAALLSRAGEHRRAAELYANAGEREHALSSWIAWSVGAEDPLAHAPDVRALGNDRASRMLDAVVRARPLDASNVELHYRVALEYELVEHLSEAVDVLRSLRSIAPAHRDVEGRLDRLSAALIAARAAAAPPSAAPPSTAAAPTSAPVATGAPPSPPAPALAGFERAELERLVSEVAAAAAVRAVSEAQRVDHRPPARRLVKKGVDGVELELEYVADSAVRLAKDGPARADLVAMIGGKPVDFENIELYYRAGLAAMAAGQWQDARQSFAAVADFSPGYRDASKRMHELDRWRQGLAKTQLAPATPRPGQPAQRYTVLGELGRGGMAVVYRARDEQLDREVALKFLAEETRDEALIAMFQREAAAVSQLQHPNIVEIHDVGTLEGRPFIAMELVDGVTIEQLLETSGKLKVLDALELVEQMLAALEFSHGKKIVHRDIKPANAMRTRDGRVKLMDFGLARSVEGKQTTIIAGTPPYMPPERLAGTGNDPRSDLFAIGVSLYELLSGQLPFEGLRRDTPPVPLRQHNPVVPKRLEAIVSRALELEPDRRFQSATELLAQLRQILQVVRAFAAKAARRPGTEPPALVAAPPPPTPTVPLPAPAAPAATRVLTRKPD